MIFFFEKNNSTGLVIICDKIYRKLIRVLSLYIVLCYTLIYFAFKNLAINFIDNSWIKYKSLLRNKK